MNYKVTSIPFFERQLKRLAKKFPSLKKDFQELSNSLVENPIQGDPIGRSSYKIRLSISSKGKGKSGGARVITHVYVAGTTVFLLSIYDKGEKATISDDDLKALLKQVEF
jgi:mRNA-degrading endonuclease RelE of RelBE toxin-antitoxin system